MSETKEKPKFSDDVIALHMRGLSGYNAQGEEIPDPRPVALPVGFTRPKSLQETMRDLLRNEEFRRNLERHEMETFEEADDFEAEDPDRDPRFPDNSPYEQDFDPLGVNTREAEIRSGFVEEIPVEKKEKARQALEDFKKKKEEAKKAKKKVKNEEEEEEEDGE